MSAFVETFSNYVSEYRGISVSLGIAECWNEWAFGYCRTFEKLGMTSLVIGPLHIQFEWEI